MSPPTVELPDEDIDRQKRLRTQNQVIPHPHRFGRTLDERRQAENLPNDEQKDFTSLKERLGIRLKDDDLRMLLPKWQKGS